MLDRRRFVALSAGAAVSAGLPSTSRDNVIERNFKPMD